MKLIKRLSDLNITVLTSKEKHVWKPVGLLCRRYYTNVARNPNMNEQGSPRRSLDAVMTDRARYTERTLLEVLKGRKAP